MNSSSWDHKYLATIVAIKLGSGEIIADILKPLTIIVVPFKNAYRIRLKIACNYLKQFPVFLPPSPPPKELDVRGYIQGLGLVVEREGYTVLFLFLSLFCSKPLRPINNLTCFSTTEEKLQVPVIPGIDPGIQVRSWGRSENITCLSNPNIPLLNFQSPMAPFCLENIERGSCIELHAISSLALMAKEHVTINSCHKQTPIDNVLFQW